MPNDLNFRTWTSLQPDFDTACCEVSDLANSVADKTFDLAILFMAGYSPEAIDSRLPQLSRDLGATTTLGVTAETVLSGEDEWEDRPALVLWTARVPSWKLTPLHLKLERHGGEAAIVGWPEALDQSWPESWTMIALGEPFEFPMDALLARLNEDRPRGSVIGGMASSGFQPGQARLLFEDRVLREGAVAVMIDAPQGDLLPVVSQGCRPIGQPMIVTRAERNTLLELGGQPALIQLKKVFDQLPTREQRMVQSGLHVGIAMSEYKDSFGYGDFLIRNVHGIDDASGAIVIGDYVRVGQTVQFHVRDHESAHVELEQMLTNATGGNPYESALLFTCNGRGTRMFPQPGHDASLVAKSVNNGPVAGFFAAGEIGPVAGRNFLHGFTASTLLVRHSAREDS